MDPNLRREVDAFLRDVFDGTDLEIALRKANLAIVPGNYEVVHIERRDREILLTYREAVFENLNHHGDYGWRRVKESFDGESFDAVDEDRLRDAMAETIEDLTDGGD